MKSHYDRLGITSSATDEEIKSAFRKKAIRQHPDKHQGSAVSEERFKQLQSSYQEIMDNRNQLNTSSSPPKQSSNPTAFGNNSDQFYDQFIASIFRQLFNRSFFSSQRSSRSNHCSHKVRPSDICLRCR